VIPFFAFPEGVRRITPREWAEAKTQFAVMFNERFVNS